LVVTEVGGDASEDSEGHGARLHYHVGVMELYSQRRFVESILNHSPSSEEVPHLGDQRGQIG
jgi:hypothetical protein